MAHVVFAAPSIERFHLHDQLARQLTHRGHEITVLADNPISACFYAAQGLPTRELRPGRHDDYPRVPLEEFAIQDCRLRGMDRPNLGLLRRLRSTLDRRVSPLLRFLEHSMPEMLFFHQGRSGLHRMLHFLATELGCETLHSGRGLLPFTLQWDEQGIDGEASACRRVAGDYRNQPRDDLLIAAALAAVLGRATPPALPRRDTLPPSWPRRLASLARTLGSDQRDSAWAWLRHCGRFPNRATATVPALPKLPETPFVTVLLQSVGSPRLLLDAHAPPSPGHLLLATQRAVEHCGLAMPLVAVLPAEGLSRGDQQLLSRQADKVRYLPAHAAPMAAALAAAVVTVNHPLAFAGVLARTPLLHLGRTPYAVAGVTRRTMLDTLPEDLGAALTAPSNDLLRDRLLTRSLLLDHVWCDALQPDPNGIRGLVQGIEQRVGHRGSRTPIYRAGPVWPLAVSSDKS